MNYIVFDLEWNQSPNGKEDSVEHLPFEIIEIGAVKLNGNFEQTGTFHKLIRPKVYKKMHFKISEVTHMDMAKLRQEGEPFDVVMNRFLAWCGEEEYCFCTWGSMDLTELQRNMAYHKLPNPFPRPLLYLDIQKLYCLQYGDGKNKVSLDMAVQIQGMEEERPFHRALDDAFYTGLVLGEMEPDQILPYASIDYYRLPDNKDEEIYMEFPGYSKYVSRIFPSREDAMKERSVTGMRCYECGRALRKKVRWFTPNQKIYYGLAICPEHGYLKGKIRMKRVDDTSVYVVKTLKLTDEDGAERIISRRDDLRKKRAERNRAKKKRQRETKQERRKKR